MLTARSRICKVVLACAAFGLASCSDSDSPGTLIVPFNLGNQRTCKEFHVETVRGELNDDEYFDEVRCDAGELRFQHIPEDSYNLRLYGYDRDDVAIMDSLQDEHLLINVINDTTVVTDPVTLTSAPARLMLRWTFGFGTCESAGITAFAVTVWRNDGSELLLKDELDCAKVGKGEGNYRQVPDHDRMLMGTDMGEVSVQPLDSAGDDFCEPLTYRYPAPGPGGDIYLSMACDEDACWGTGDDDESRAEAAPSAPEGHTGKEKDDKSL